MSLNLSPCVLIVLESLIKLVLISAAGVGCELINTHFVAGRSCVRLGLGGMGGKVFSLDKFQGKKREGKSLASQEVQVHHLQSGLPRDKRTHTHTQKLKRAANHQLTRPQRWPSWPCHCCPSRRRRRRRRQPTSYG